MVFHFNQWFDSPSAQKYYQCNAVGLFRLVFQLFDFFNLLWESGRLFIMAGKDDNSEVG